MRKLKHSKRGLTSSPRSYQRGVGELDLCLHISVPLKKMILQLKRFFENLAFSDSFISNAGMWQVSPLMVAITIPTPNPL